VLRVTEGLLSQCIVATFELLMCGTECCTGSQFGLSNLGPWCMDLEYFDCNSMVLYANLYSLPGFLCIPRYKPGILWKSVEPGFQL